MQNALFRNGLCWIDSEQGGDVSTVKPSGKTKGAMGLVYILERASAWIA
jgi:hypothetical protein